MNAYEFDNQINRLMLVYGDKYYPDERRKSFWKKFQHLPMKVFADVIEMVIADVMSPPSLSKILEVGRAKIGEYYDEKRRRELALVKETQCDLCNSSGMVLATHKDEDPWSLPTAFRCRCTNPDMLRLTHSIQTWDDSIGYVRCK